MHGQYSGTPLVEEEAGVPVHKRRKHPTRRSAERRRAIIDGFSHDVRTPLVVITEYLGLLSETTGGPSDGEQRQIVEVIAERVDDLSQTINAFLDTIKLDSGTLGVCRRKYPVADLIAHVRDGLVRKADMRRCQLQFDVPTDLPNVFCDKEQIGRALVNLVTQSIKSRPRQETIQLRARCNDQQTAVLISATQDGQNGAFAESRANGPWSITGSAEAGKSLDGKLRLARNVAQLNLANLESECLEGGTIFWLNLPAADLREVVSRYLRQMIGGRRHEFTVSFAKVCGAGTIEGKSERDVNSLLGMLVRPIDLIFPVERGVWLLALARKRPDLPKFIRRAEVLREAINGKRLREPLPAIVVEPLGTWWAQEGIGPLLETINASFEGSAK